MSGLSRTSTSAFSDPSSSMSGLNLAEPAIRAAATATAALPDSLPRPAFASSGLPTPPFATRLEAMATRIRPIGASIRGAAAAAAALPDSLPIPAFAGSGLPTPAFATRVRPTGASFGGAAAAAAALPDSLPIPAFAGSGLPTPAFATRVRPTGASIGGASAAAAALPDSLPIPAFAGEGLPTPPFATRVRPIGASIGGAAAAAEALPKPAFGGSGLPIPAFGVLPQARISAGPRGALLAKATDLSDRRSALPAFTKVPTKGEVSPLNCFLATHTHVRPSRIAHKATAISGPKSVKLPLSSEAVTSFEALKSSIKEGGSITKEAFFDALKKLIPADTYKGNGSHSFGEVIESDIEKFFERTLQLLQESKVDRTLPLYPQFLKWAKVVANLQEVHKTVLNGFGYRLGYIRDNEKDYVGASLRRTLFDEFLDRLLPGKEVEFSGSFVIEHYLAQVLNSKENLTSEMTRVSHEIQLHSHGEAAAEIDYRLKNALLLPLNEQILALEARVASLAKENPLILKKYHAIYHAPTKAEENLKKALTKQAQAENRKRKAATELEELLEHKKNLEADQTTLSKDLLKLTLSSIDKTLAKGDLEDLNHDLKTLQKAIDICSWVLEQEEAELQLANQTVLAAQSHNDRSIAEKAMTEHDLTLTDLEQFELLKVLEMKKEEQEKLQAELNSKQHQITHARALTELAKGEFYLLNGLFSRAKA